MYNIYTYINDININQTDPTYKYSRKCINSIVAIVRVISNINASKLLDFNKIITTNHRRFLIDFNIKTYFKMNTLELEELNQSKLDLNRKSY